MSTETATRSGRLPSRKSLAIAGRLGNARRDRDRNVRLHLVEDLGQRRGVRLIHREDDGLADLACRVSLRVLQERLAHRPGCARA